MGQVGEVFVRIRPRPEDLRMLELVRVLQQDIAAAFDRFHAGLAKLGRPPLNEGEDH